MIMSADLLAEFDSFYRQPNDSNHSNQHQPDASQKEAQRNTWQQNSSQSFVDSIEPRSHLTTTDDDDWGEFESGQTFDASQNHNEVFTNFEDTRDKHDEGIELNVSSRPDVTYAHSNISSGSHLQTGKETRQQPRNENVIFDVDDLSDVGDLSNDDNEFGDFEIADQIRSSTTTESKSSGVVVAGKPSETLIDFGGGGGDSDVPPNVVPRSERPNYAVDMIRDLDLKSTPAPLNAGSILDKTETDSMPQNVEQADLKDQWHWDDNKPTHTEAPKAISNPESYQYPRILLSGSKVCREKQSNTLQKRDPSNVTSSRKPVVDDPWDDFEDDERTRDNKASEPYMEDASHTNNEPELPRLLQSNIEKEKMSLGPPTNVPPPALLFPLFPPIFAKVQSALYEPVSRQTDVPTLRSGIVSKGTAKEFLITYLAIATVVARVIAGRKLRWKRDVLLSQSMRIGPASSGKSSGMKLAGIDKGEILKEDREVADVVKLWKAQAGRLRSAISSAGIMHPVPEIAETLPVRLAQQSEVAVNAPKPCALCALKRNERVPKVDYEVQDNFGEFWTEHWGHTMCMKVWYSYERQLAAR